MDIDQTLKLGISALKKKSYRGGKNISSFSKEISK